MGKLVWFRWPVFLFFLLLWPGGCSDPTPEPAKAEGENFTIGFECGFEPYGFRDAANGEYIGFDFDLAREAARRNGWQLICKPLDWRLKDALLNNDEIDCIWNGFHLESRENLFEWTTPYSASSQEVIVRRDSAIRSWDDLAGKAVAVQATAPNYAMLAHGSARELGRRFGRLISVPGFQELMLMLEQPGVDAVITDSLAAAYWIKRRDAAYRLTGLQLQPTHTAVAFKRGNTALRDQLEKTLEEMRADGTMKRLSVYWFERDVTGTMPAAGGAK